MQPPKKKKRDWSEDGTWDTAQKASPGGTERGEPATERPRTVTVALDGPARPAPAPDGASTTIGPSIVVRGRLISHEDLVVHGRIEASVRSSRDLRLEQSGVILADIEVRSATIDGIVVGSIRATERVELNAGARVVGDIDSPVLVVQDGAKFRGEVDMQGLEALQRSPRPTAAARPAPKPEPTKAPPPRTRPAPAPVVPMVAATIEASDPGDEPDVEAEPPPVVIPPSRPAVTVPAPSQPAVTPRVRRPEPVAAAAATPTQAAPAPQAGTDAAPAPSKRGWFSLG